MRAIFVFLIFFSGAAWGLDYGSYADLAKKGDTVNRAVVNSHLDAIATSFITYERMVSRAFKKRLICMPNNIMITPKVIEHAIEVAQKRYKKRNLKKFPVSELAFIGLVERYPCAANLRRP